MKIKKFLITIICFFVVSGVLAATPNPTTMMQSISDKMITALKKNRPQSKTNPNLIYNLVDSIVVPYADVVGMSRSVLGRNAWMGATKSEKNAFIQAFKRVVISTYASALNAYTDETIKFFPIRGGYKGQRRIQIDSRIIRSNGQPISVYYRLALINGTWKIYDFNVEGVSLLQSFHAQFSDQLTKGKTVVEITKNLNQRKLKMSRDH